MKYTSLFIAILVLFGLWWAYSFYEQSQYEMFIASSVDLDQVDRISFEVESGEGIRSIATRLENKGLIGSSWALYEYVKRNNLGEAIQAGNFLLRKSYTIPEVVDYLTRARQDEVPVTIVEGLTAKQMDAKLAKDGITAQGAFEQCVRECSFDYDFLTSKPADQSLEGYLFPDTYFVLPSGTEPNVLIERMLRNFQKRTLAVFSNIGDRNVHQLVTMASVIEREGRNDDERTMISGILWKRFDAGMPLGADATVRYLTNNWTDPLYARDLEIDSPYNTRKNIGLPPGPIGNPGLASIEAAINPKESQYWYYLHDSNGEIHYAITNEEHNINKKTYL